MHKIIQQIKDIIATGLKEHLPEVLVSDYENDGAVFYMNGKNGAEFDWYVNEKISDFMVFYDDESKLGAAKLTIYDAGDILMYIYGDKGKSMVQEVKTYLDVTKEEMLDLAVLLKNEGEDKDIWDGDIDSINTDREVTDEERQDFVKKADWFDDIKERKNMLPQMCYVSKKIIDEGWKVGYMSRDEAVNEYDSGWAFMVGNESVEYTEDSNNILLMSIHEITQIDRDVWKYITHPVGTGLVRVSSDEFEVDEEGKEIFFEKRVEE